MTTPERLRRRQRIEGGLIIAIGLLMLWQTWFFNERDAGQQECLQENFAALAESLDAREGLTSRESEATQRVIQDVSDSQDRATLTRAFNEFKKEQDAIEKVRKQNPIPPYPPGLCNKG